MSIAVPFNELKECESLHIECCVDILDIELKPNMEELLDEGVVNKFMSSIPPISDTSFVWNISEEILAEFKEGSPDRYRYHYSDNFMNNCFVLGCDPHFNLDEVPEEEPKVLLALNMLRAPKEVQSVTISVHFMAFCDQTMFKKVVRATLELDAYETSCDELLFSSSMLSSLSVLSFVVELKVIETRYRERP